MVGLAAALAVWSNTMASRVEEPKHTVALRDGDFELRVYAPRVVAETRVSGAWDKAGNEGFRRLAGYIFGGNRARTKVAMTAPVAQRPESERIAMTAPVGQARTGDDWAVTFTMPSTFTLETLPEPNDSRVTLREIGEQRVASVRFSGRWTEARMQSETARLLEWVRARGWRAVSAPELSRYDPPWTLPFLRRNEIWVRVEQPEPS